MKIINIKKNEFKLKEKHLKELQKLSKVHYFDMKFHVLCLWKRN